MGDDNSQENEQMLYAMCRYLFETGKSDSAKALLSAQLVGYTINDVVIDQSFDGAYYGPAYSVLLRGPSRFVKEFMKKVDLVDDDFEPYEGHSDLYNDTQEAFNALMPSLEGKFGTGQTTIEAKLELHPVDTNWRAMLSAEIETDKPTNQGPIFAKNQNIIVHEGQKFSSPAEVEIAKALDRLGVMYLPNCLARIGFKGMSRENKYPDFLITYKGRWGILEVDGQTYHTNSNATKDHERSRALEQHGGIKYFTRYDALRCMKEPDRVVAEFLRILETK